MKNNSQSSSWQFIDQLRVQSNKRPSLSLNDSVWITSYASKWPEKERLNFDVNNSTTTTTDGNNNSEQSKSDFNVFNFDWKIEPTNLNPLGDFGINEGIYSKPSLNFNQNFNQNSNSRVVNGKSGGGDDNNNNKVNNSDKDGSKNLMNKRFKTLPTSEFLPTNETVGGYIFVRNNDTMQENLKSQLFGLPPRYRDPVRQITPGLPPFLYNYSSHQLRGVFEREKGRASVENTDHEIVPTVETSITIFDEIVSAVDNSVAVVDEIVQAEQFHSRFIRNAFGEKQPGTGFIVGSFLALLQIKSEGKSQSPFETHARTMSLCIISLSIYAVAYAAQHVFSVSKTDRTNTCAIFARWGMMLCFLILVASLASLFFL